MVNWSPVNGLLNMLSEDLFDFQLGVVLVWNSVNKTSCHQHCATK